MENVLLEKWTRVINSTKAAPVVNKEAMAQILENQEEYLIKEANSVADMAQYTPILLPAVRRMFPNLLANEIVGVQPLTSPTGYAYAMRYSYGKGSSVGSTDRGKFDRQGGGVLQNAKIQFTSVALICTTPVVITTGAVTAGTVTATAVYSEVNRVLINCASVLDAEIVKASTTVIIDGTSYTVSFAMNNEAGYNLIFNNYAKVVSTVAGETMGAPGGAEFRDMKLELERASVEVMTRKMKAEYSLELAQDLKNVHGLDAEAELINILEYEISAELDRELVETIKSKSTITPQWSYGSVGLQTNTDGFADGRWEQEKFRTLYTRILKEANQIALTTRRGTANFIICSTNAITALESLSNFMFSAVPGDVKPTLGVAKVGTLDGRFAVYLDTFASTDYVVVGYKGTGQFDTGVIYCPYVPLMMMKVTDPNTMQPKIGFMTRDAIMGNMFGTQNYYRMIPLNFSGSQLLASYDFGVANY